MITAGSGVTLRGPGAAGPHAGPQSALNVVLGTLDPPAGLPREAEVVGLTVQIGDTIGGDVGGEGGVHLVLQQAVLATKTSI